MCPSLLEGAGLRVQRFREQWARALVHAICLVPPLLACYMDSGCRTWAVHKGHKSMCARKSFIVRLNFAGNAHMVQGQNLEAAWADFLDVDTVPRPHAELAAYIAAARVRQAEAYLIVRAFPQSLLRMGKYVVFICSWRWCAATFRTRVHWSERRTRGFCDGATVRVRQSVIRTSQHNLGRRLRQIWRTRCRVQGIGDSVTHARTRRTPHCFVLEPIAARARGHISLVVRPQETVLHSLPWSEVISFVHGPL